VFFLSKNYELFYQMAKTVYHSYVMPSLGTTIALISAD